jgi:hypothetical protein
MNGTEVDLLSRPITHIVQIAQYLLQGTHHLEVSSLKQRGGESNEDNAETTLSNHRVPGNRMIMS